MAKKSWQEKLHPQAKFPQIVTAEKSMLGIAAGETMVIVSPLEYEEKMRDIPFGKVKTVPQLRQEFAKKYGTKTACPLTGGIFVNIVAHAAEEESLNGKKDTVAWWRTVKTNGELNDKFPGGIAEQAKRLQAEGRKIYSKGKRAFVVLD